MITVKLIAIGSLKEGYLKDAFSEYSKRLGGMCNFELIELKEHKLPDSPSEKEISTALSEEGKRILPLLSPRAFKIALCVEGKQLSSEHLARALSDVSMSYSEICLVIGSSHGLCDEVKTTCDLRLSVSKLTFPHQLMRIILAEVLYRSFNIIKGTKYHK